MPDRREILLDAAIAAVREGGYAALTQPKVAARAGMSQSHLTYYFPTRSDLVKAVAERIVHAQLARLEQQAGPLSQEAAVRDVTALATSTDTTRVFMALVLAADAEPSARAPMRELVSGMRQRTTYLLAALAGDTESPERILSHTADGRLFHAVAVGAAILSLTEGDQADNEATEQMIRHLLEMLTAPERLIPSHTSPRRSAETEESPVTKRRRVIQAVR
jgi:AcrR family transcriptional regulator